MKKKTKQQIENCLVSELRNMVLELQNGSLTEELLYNYFRIFMCDACYIRVNHGRHDS